MIIKSKSFIFFAILLCLMMAEASKNSESSSESSTGVSESDSETSSVEAEKSEDASRAQRWTLERLEQVADDVAYRQLMQELKNKKQAFQVMDMFERDLQKVLTL